MTEAIAVLVAHPELVWALLLAALLFALVTTLKGYRFKLRKKDLEILIETRALSPREEARRRDMP